MNDLVLAYLGAMIGGHAAAHKPMPDGVKAWFEDFLHSDPGTRDEVSQALVRMGECAVPCLAEFLMDSDPAVANWARSTLMRIGAPAVPVIRALAEDQDGNGRSVAMTVVESMAQ